MSVCLCMFAALGQIMLYVDGMEGIALHTDTLQWLYTLLSSQVSVIDICYTTTNQVKYC